MAAGQEFLSQQIPLWGGLHGRGVAFLGDILRMVCIAAGTLFSHEGVPRDGYHTLLYGEVIASAYILDSYP